MSLKWEPIAVVGAVVTVAVSLAVTLSAGGGLPWPYATLLALLVTAIMIPLALRAQSAPVPTPAADASRKLDDTIAGLSRRLHEVERRLVELDERMIDISRTTVRALATELDTVGSVVRDLAEAVALHDAELFAPRSPREAGSKAGQSPSLATETPAAAAADAPPEAIPQRFPAAEIDAVTRALRTEEMELLLQAVVTLPQRRVRLYEAQPRVRLPTGLNAGTARVLAIAESQGLSRELDHFVLHHAMRVARHLASRNRDVPVLFRGSATALLDASLFRLLAEAVAADPAFASRILFEIPFGTFRDAGALEREALEALYQIGIRFVVDAVPDLVIEARSLAARGVRYVRVGAQVLLGAAAGQVRAEIHPADLSGYLARHGLTLIVEDVSTEQVSLELFEFDIPLGIGPLYAPPRPVRMDVLLDASSAPAEPAPPPLAAEASPSSRGSDPEEGSQAVSEARAATQARGTSLRAFLRRTSG